MSVLALVYANAHQVSHPPTITMRGIEEKECLNTGNAEHAFVDLWGMVEGDVVIGTDQPFMTVTSRWAQYT